MHGLDRAEEAAVRFTYRPADVFTSAFDIAFRGAEAAINKESDPDLLRLAQVFEKFVAHPVEGVRVETAALLAAAFYWIAGYTANALVISRRLPVMGQGTAHDVLVHLLRRTLRASDRDSYGGEIARRIMAYVETGDQTSFNAALATADLLVTRAVERRDVDDYVVGHLLGLVLRRLDRVSLWTSIDGRTSAPRGAWVDYANSQIELHRPVIDLWPSQRAAIGKGLLDGQSSIAIRTPTSSGKTKMTELAFVNDLFTDDRKCLYLAPFRSLVTETESALGATLTSLNIPFATLYGGSEANELEARLSEVARVVIATPEKIAAVLKLKDSGLSAFGTIVLDEGHLLDAGDRGAAYELQLALLRSTRTTLANGDARSRTIFLSAVLPNSEEIAEWLGGSIDSLVADDWQPTSVRIGVVTWARNQAARVDYTAGDVSFFAPRILEEDTWRERNAETRRLRTHHFPSRSSNSSIAAALAFKSIRSGPVLVYAQQPRYAVSIARHMVERLRLNRPLEPPFAIEGSDATRAELADYIGRRIGPGSVLSDAVRAGIGLHHGGLPQSLRLVIEQAFKSGDLRVLVATNTIAQGVNFPVKTIIVHTLPGSEAPRRDLWNLIGRAGRALRETEGDVLILRTGELTALRLRTFLQRANIEPVESQILALVRRFVDAGLVVEPETLDALIVAEGETWQPIVNAIDSALVEVLFEDLVDSPAYIAFVDSLLAVHQARRLDVSGSGGGGYEASVRALLELRRSSVLSAVPDALTRRRYARAGISIDTAARLAANRAQLGAIADSAPDLTEDAFAQLVELVAPSVELRGCDVTQISRLGYVWLRTGSYVAVNSAAVESGFLFSGLDDVVKFVEQTLVHRLTWVLNAMLRLHETVTVEGTVVNMVILPDWISQLPQFLRYGVSTPQLVWAMSLGLSDPAFGQWVLDRFERENGQAPASFAVLGQWLVRTRADTAAAVRTEWPSYFSRVFEAIVDRNAAITARLSSIPTS